MTNTQLSVVNPASITFPPPSRPLRPATSHWNRIEFLTALEDLIIQCGTNKNEQVLAMIEACISEGVNTRPQIVAIGRQLGFNYRHVAKQLTDATGPSQSTHRWQVDKQGGYTLHSAPTSDQASTEMS